MAIRDDLAAEIIEPLARRLTELKDDQSKASDSRSWDMARAYVAAYKQLQEIEPGITPQVVNRQIKAYRWYKGPGGSWLSNAKKTAETFSDFFTNVHKSSLAFWAINCISNCSLSAPEKQELLDWYQAESPTAQELRYEIRRLVSMKEGVTRPDFDLKVSNLWKFSTAINGNGWDGGIHPDLIANLLYYYTDPGDVVVDPMAGGDLTHRVTQMYRFFRDDYQGDFGGTRLVYRSDIAPQHPGIEQADITKSLPWPDEFADLVILDPPYYGMAHGKYSTWGKTIEEWQNSLCLAIHQVKRITKTGGKVAIITDDYMRKDGFYPLGFLTFQALSQADLAPIGTMYDPCPNFVITMGPAQMWRTKRARLQVSEMKIINVFEKPSSQ